ncbi:leucine-rich repeat-containing protein 59 [Triplophysa dalaica]|uniref:leucine-rich repeat-containing protein 59 n=1 Tax=Triplophysa dalaica TaxID=1582913 RepID=UPI0024DFB8E3|nr:leucine-rich repeat-containing protein 59 [Triplophysa dalaica]XP_056628115.1 leucine-rich repeat-containing protein 59 [Triplophysa dalaica]
MNKGKVENLRDKIDGNEVDLSLSNLTEVPVKELATFPKATALDLSCNNLTTLTLEFCNLTHLVKIDLSKNQLVCLPDEIGQLCNLQHLDLYNNKLRKLPVSFSQLRSLKWLDLKDNPLEATLAKAAGDCLDEKQCKQCASMVLQHMKVLQEEADMERERRLLKERVQEKKKEDKQREREAKEKEAQKKKKADEKEKKRQEYQAQMSALAAQEQQKKKREEKKKKAAQNDGKKTNSESVSKGKRSICSLFFSYLLKLLLLLIVGVSSVLAVCQLTELRKEAYCVPVNVHFDETVRWAQTLDIVRQVNQIMSDLRVWD